MVEAVGVVIPSPAMWSGASVEARLTSLLLQSLQQELMPARDQELMPEHELMPFLQVAEAMGSGASVGAWLTPFLFQSL